MRIKNLVFLSILFLSPSFALPALAREEGHAEGHAEEHKEVHKEEMKKTMSHKPEIMPFDTKENNAYKEYGRKKIMQIFQNSDYLSLTEEQLKSLKSLRNDCMKKIIRSNADKKIAILELVESLNKTEPDLEGNQLPRSKLRGIEGLFYITFSRQAAGN